jgi:hypothetical protein
VVFLRYNLIAGSVMKENYDFARYDFYVRQNLNCYTIATTQDTMFMLGQFLEKN